MSESVFLSAYFADHHPYWLPGNTLLTDDQRATKLGEAELGLRLVQLRRQLVEVMRLDLQVPALESHETDRYRRDVEQRDRF